MRAILFTLLFLALADPALASDGVLEINQTCAIETGCFSGDTAGYPVTIDGSAGSSYRLTSNLTGIGADTNGIFLNTSRITLDFNGFSLAGFAIGIGTGNGITGGGVDGAFAGFATIKNGVIRGFRALGVALAGAKGVRIENMTFEFNAGGGVEVGDDARILKNGFSNNGSSATSTRGLFAGSGSLILQNVVTDSNGRGIFAGDDSIIKSNIANRNGGAGISSGRATILGNSSNGNAGSGISTGSSTTITGNIANENGSNGISAGAGSTVSNNTACLNAANGISSSFDTLVAGNTVRDNGTSGVGFGLKLSTGAGWRDNLITNTVALPFQGTVDGTGVGSVDAGGNVCNGSLTCP